MSNDQGEIIGGYIILIVGYQDFDEEGGASDGIDDEMKYEFHKITQEMGRFISKQN